MSPSRRALVDELDRYDRLLEVGVGTRPGVARALADRGREVVAIDVDAAAAVDAAADVDTDADVDAPSERSAVDSAGSLSIRRGDVVALAATDDPLAALGSRTTDGAIGVDGFDAVYALNLPAELQRPTVSLANRLEADCPFTTLGFEEPIVPVTRRRIGAITVYLPRGPSPGP